MSKIPLALNQPIYPVHTGSVLSQLISRTNEAFARRPKIICPSESPKLERCPKIGSRLPRPSSCPVAYSRSETISSGCQNNDQNFQRSLRQPCSRVSSAPSSKASSPRPLNSPAPTFSSEARAKATRAKLLSYPNKTSITYKEQYLRKIGRKSLPPRTPVTSASSQMSKTTTATAPENVRQVQYNRKEMEILHSQLQSKENECASLKTKLKTLTKSLDDSNLRNDMLELSLFEYKEKAIKSDEMHGVLDVSASVSTATQVPPTISCDIGVQKIEFDKKESKKTCVQNKPFQISVAIQTKPIGEYMLNFGMQTEPIRNISTEEFLTASVQTENEKNLARYRGGSNLNTTECRCQRDSSLRNQTNGNVESSGETPTRTTTWNFNFASALQDDSQALTLEALKKVVNEEELNKRDIYNPLVIALVTRDELLHHLRNLLQNIQNCHETEHTEVGDDNPSKARDTLLYHYKKNINLIYNYVSDRMTHIQSLDKKTLFQGASNSKLYYNATSNLDGKTTEGIFIPFYEDESPIEPNFSCDGDGNGDSLYDTPEDNIEKTDQKRRNERESRGIVGDKFMNECGKDKLIYSVDAEDKYQIPRNIDWAQGDETFCKDKIEYIHLIKPPGRLERFFSCEDVNGEMEGLSTVPETKSKRFSNVKAWLDRKSSSMQSFVLGEDILKRFLDTSYVQYNENVEMFELFAKTNQLQSTSELSCASFSSSNQDVFADFSETTINDPHSCETRMI